MKLTASIYRLHGPGDLRVEEEVLDTDRLAPRQIAARTLFSAVSTGTELAAYRGDPPLRPTPAPYPRLVGYCNVAEVVAIGSEVTRVVPGDFIYTGQSHRSAFVCDEEGIHATLPPSIDLAQAATAYLFHLGYTALQDARLSAGGSLGVIGLGVLGLTTVACARAEGHEVTAISSHPGSLSLAASWGAKAVLKQDVDINPRFHSIVVTSNAWSDWKLAMQTAHPRGTIAVLGFPGRGQSAPDFNPLDSRWFYDKLLTIAATGPAQSTDDLRHNLAHLIRLIHAGKLNAASFISKTIDWNELPALYRTMAEDRGSLLTAILKW